jgi:hypothetical protein
LTRKSNTSELPLFTAHKKGVNWFWVSTACNPTPAFDATPAADVDDNNDLFCLLTASRRIRKHLTWLFTAPHINGAIYLHITRTYSSWYKRTKENSNRRNKKESECQNRFKWCRK